MPFLPSCLPTVPALQHFPTYLPTQSPRLVTGSAWVADRPTSSYLLRASPSTHSPIRISRESAPCPRVWSASSGGANECGDAVLSNSPASTLKAVELPNKRNGHLRLAISQAQNARIDPPARRRECGLHMCAFPPSKVCSSLFLVATAAPWSLVEENFFVLLIQPFCPKGFKLVTKVAFPRHSGGSSLDRLHDLKEEEAGARSTPQADTVPACEQTTERHHRAPQVEKEKVFCRGHHWVVLGKTAGSYHVAFAPLWQRPPVLPRCLHTQ